MKIEAWRTLAERLRSLSVALTSAYLANTGLTTGRGLLLVAGLLLAVGPASAQRPVPPSLSVITTGADPGVTPFVMLFTANTTGPSSQAVPALGGPGGVSPGVTLTPAPPVFLSGLTAGPINGVFYGPTKFTVGPGGPTGWVNAKVTPGARSFQILFVASNVGDCGFASALAIDNLKINSTVIQGFESALPGTWAVSPGGSFSISTAVTNVAPTEATHFGFLGADPGNTSMTFTAPLLSAGTPTPTCGSWLLSPSISTGASDVLSVDLDFMTNDGDGFSDFAFVALVGPVGPACRHHTVHGHMDATVVNHPGNQDIHHGQHGHTVIAGQPLCGHNPIPGHTGLMPDPGESLFSLTSAAPEALTPTFWIGVNEDGSLNGEPGGMAATKQGAVLQLFGSASGFFMDPDDRQPALDFTPPASGSPLYYTTSLPQVKIGGVPAKVEFSGLAPGLKGVWQISVRIPEELAPGKVPVEVLYEGDPLAGVRIVVE